MDCKSEPLRDNDWTAEQIWKECTVRKLKPKRNMKKDEHVELLIQLDDLKDHVTSQDHSPYVEEITDCNSNCIDPRVNQGPPRTSIIRWTRRHQGTPPSGFSLGGIPHDTPITYGCFAATVGGVQAQSLPYDLKVGQELGVSFSTQVSPGTLTTSGGAITGFVAAGTGEVEGAAVPEPTSVMLLASVLLGIGMRWSRC